MFDILSFYLLSPTYIDYSIEDDELPNDYNDDTYDTSHPTGFIESMKQEETRKNELTSKRDRELEDVDIDVNVDNMEDYEGEEDNYGDDEDI